MWGRGAAADSLPGHVCQQLLSWPREEQGGADLAGNQGKGRPFLDRHSVITVCQILGAPKLTGHGGGETSPVSFPQLRQAALPSVATELGVAEQGWVWSSGLSIYMGTGLFS